METVAHSATLEPSTFTYREDAKPGAAWGAVLAGSVAGAAFFLILLALGAGFELSVVSPWSNAGWPSKKLEAGAVIWLVFTEVIASALGGYLTGRLRVKWVSVHTDEVHFRDTANGFLSWAVALVLSVFFLVSTTASVVGASQGHIHSPAESAQPSSGLDTNAYFVDKLFRSDRPDSERNDSVARAEAAHVLAKGVRQDQFPMDDQDYLVRLTAVKAGITPTEASRRVSAVITEFQQTEEAARKLAGRVLVWTFLALLMGAFSASIAATLGGRHRDHLHALRAS